MSDIFAFVSVARHLSFTKASTETGIPKSTLSRKVSALEASLGVTLMHRTTRHLKLTETGESYFLGCTRILTDLEQLHKKATENQAQPIGKIRITAPAEIGKQLLAMPLASFADKHPHVHLDIVLTDRLVDLWSEGFDLALRAGQALKDSSLKSIKISRDSFVLVASPHYLKKNGLPKTPMDLKKHKCIVFAPHGRSMEWTLCSGNTRNKVKVIPFYKTDNLSMAMHLATMGLGISFLPKFLIEEPLITGELQRVLPLWTQDHNRFYIVYPEQKFMPLSTRLLIDHLKEWFKKKA